MIHFSILESSPQDMQDFLLVAPVGKKLPREIRPRRERKKFGTCKKVRILSLQVDFTRYIQKSMQKCSEKLFDVGFCS